MLSRTAEHIFWMARYMERADCTARLIEMGTRMAMLPGAREDDEWRSVAMACGAGDDFVGDVRLTSDKILSSLMLDCDNPGSIRACMDRARSNGRAVRTALTRDMWEALNEGWRRLEGLDARTAQRELPVLLDWVKGRAALFRGASATSMLRNDGFDFLNLGANLERADMTLRLLDVKYWVLLPETDVVGGGRDHHQWTSVLHATSAMRAYHHIYRGDYAPWKIADFLILNRAFPRSVAYCCDQINNSLNRLADRYGTTHECHETAKRFTEELARREMGELFREGLHEFIHDGIRATRKLNAEISSAYYF
ncbi:alpha-E domain-containing protein [Rhodobacteraceae bacterium NNCM2]|nr:alpha-E domain-containing protein [Coraliihabitans acroporae]